MGHEKLPLMTKYSISNSDPTLPERFQVLFKALSLSILRYRLA